TSVWGLRRFNAFPARGKLAKFRLGCASERGTWLTNVVGPSIAFPTRSSERTRIANHQRGRSIMTRARLDSTPPAPLRRYLQVVECRYPRFWEQLATRRRMHTASGLWPSWCDLPLSRVHEVVCPEDAARDPTRLVDVAIIGGLAAWRVHQT